MDQRISIYRKIYDDLLKKIREEDYKVGQLLPTELELSRIYGVSRPTIRKALGLLAQNGYVQRKKKEGTRVINKKITQGFTHLIQSYNSEMAKKGMIPKTKVLDFSIEVAKEEVIENLNLNSGDKVYKLIRLRYSNNDPIVLVTTYLPEKYLSQLEDYDFEKESLYEVLKSYNFYISRITRILNVEKSNQIESALLGIGNCEPVFKFKSTAKAQNGCPIEYSLSTYRGDKNTFIFELDK